MPAIDRAGATLSWEEFGSGPAALFVHGGLFDPMTGERFWATPGVAGDLAAACRVLVPDRRCSPGRTTAGFSVHSWEREAEDLAAILDAAGIERAHLVAGSNGCSAIARLALSHPERVASLVCCWPAAPTTAALLASFERSAAAVERDGTAGYLDTLRREGVPRPGEERAGFPFGFALLHDRQMAASFLECSGTDAARIFRETGAALLPGEPIRGLSGEEAARIGTGGFPVYVMPAEPDDPYHPRAVALALRDVIPGAILTAGYPVTPSRFFADARAGFAATLRGIVG
ncbi:MAG TPA: alpha/beta hydrolase [Thermomicrobiales bacterium]|nr:alpha/beta hydrolase [Thermomicrobiales bacterium]